MVDFVSSDRSRILIYFGLLTVLKTVLTAMFILSISVIMPGIWVYNFMQLFVITCTTLSISLSTRISQIVQTSITASDLIRGRITLLELSDFWVHGPRAPASKIIQTGAFVERLASFIIVVSSISFSWLDVQTAILEGQCQPPLYTNATLAPGINLPNYLQGDVDYAEIYNYGLPLADGLIGGWAGWPVQNPMPTFWIQGEGPVYVIQVLCDNGTPSPTNPFPIATHVTSTLIGSSARTLMLESQILFPAGSVFDDITGAVITDFAVLQTCTTSILLSHGTVTFQFNSDQWQMVTNGQARRISSPDEKFSSVYMDSVSQYGKDAYNNFESFGDEYGVLPLLTEAILIMFENQSYFPSQGATFCNIFSEGTLPDGYYHTNTTFRGLVTGIGTAAHFTLMQYLNTITVPCTYTGYTGAGMLVIPSLTVYVSTSASICALALKIFEILWWFMAQTDKDPHAYRRARRVLRHPFRFSLDLSAMLHARTQTSISRASDGCDITTSKMLDETGVLRIMYGEDISRIKNEDGHLRVAEYGKVKSVTEDRKYGTYKISSSQEMDELVAQLSFLPQMTTSEKKELGVLACHNLIKKVPFLQRKMNDGRDELFYDLLTDSLTERMFAPNAFIVQQGEQAVEMFFLMTGRANIYVDGVMVGQLKEGCFFGELALMDQIPRTASIMATNYCTVYALGAKEFQLVLKEFEDVRVRLKDVVYEHRRGTQSKRRLPTTADTVFEDTNQLEISDDVNWATYMNSFRPIKNSPELPQFVDPTQVENDLLAQLIRRDVLKDAGICGGSSISIPTPHKNPCPSFGILSPTSPPAFSFALQLTPYIPFSDPFMGSGPSFNTMVPGMMNNPLGGPLGFQLGPKT
ncbi:anaphase-promoting complex subunit Hcn1 [Podochytrium sp. JEL0797]|nr:anaphase-promoting complex subunit Hcn1 [Podochytrium sp. JEL0797]